MFSGVYSSRCFINHHCSPTGNDLFPLVAFKIFFFFKFLAVKYTMGLNMVVFVFLLPGIHLASLIYVFVSFSEVLENLWSIFPLTCISFPSETLIMHVKLFDCLLLIPPPFFLSTALFLHNFFFLAYYSFNVLISPTLKFSFLVNVFF